MNKLNAKGFTHLILPAIVVIAVGSVGAYILAASHADPITSDNATTGATSSAYKYAAKDMYGDRVGPSTTAIDGGATVQVISKGSKASIVNNVYDKSLAKPFDAWVAAHLGKKARFCISARATGATARLNGGINVSSGSMINTSVGADLTSSSTYKNYCGSYSALQKQPKGTHVTFTINMYTPGKDTLKSSSGPLRIKSAELELK